VIYHDYNPTTRPSQHKTCGAIIGGKTEEFVKERATYVTIENIILKMLVVEYYFITQTLHFNRNHLQNVYQNNEDLFKTVSFIRSVSKVLNTFNITVLVQKDDSMIRPL